MLVSTTTTFSRERTRASLISSGIEVSKTLESRRRLILANECVGAVGTNPTVNCESWAVSMMVVELCEEAFYRARLIRRLSTIFQLSWQHASDETSSYMDRYSLLASALSVYGRFRDFAVGARSGSIMARQYRYLYTGAVRPMMAKKLFSGR